MSSVTSPQCLSAYRHGRLAAKNGSTLGDCTYAMKRGFGKVYRRFWIQGFLDSERDEPEQFTLREHEDPEVRLLQPVPVETPVP